MKFYRCSKSILKWKEMVQISYKWNLPILIDTEKNVILGNSIKDALPDSIIVVQIDTIQRDFLFQSLFDIENSIAQENSLNRLENIQGKLKEYFILCRTVKPEYVELFSFKETRCITPELYIEPPPYDFNKHKAKEEILFNGGYLLSEDFRDPEEEKTKESDIEIDLEIMKELL